MSDDIHKDIEDAVIARKKQECVPETMEDRFTAVDLSAGLFGGMQLIAGCNKCGALVYPTALDRHLKFHEETK